MTHARKKHLAAFLLGCGVVLSIAGALLAAEAPPPPPPPPPPRVPANLVPNPDFEIDADRDGVPDGWFHSEPQHWTGPAEGGDRWKDLRELWAKKGAVPSSIPFRPPDTLEGGAYKWESPGYRSARCITVDETGELKWGEWDTVVDGIKPNTDYVIMGVRKQSAPSGRKPGVSPWVNLAAFGKILPVKGTIQRDGWVPFAAAVNSGEFAGRCKIGFIIDRAPTKVWLDNVAMFEGTMSDIPRFLAGQRGAALEYPFHDAAYASPDLECPLFFDLLWSLYGANGERTLEVVIDLPEGLDLTGGDSANGVRLAEPSAQAVTIEGRPYVRRTFQVLSAKERAEFELAGRRPVRLWLKADPKLAPGAFEAFYHAGWKLGTQPGQRLVVKVMEFGKVRQPRSLLTAVGGFSAELVSARANKLAKDLPAIGINSVFVEGALSPEAAEQLEKAGVTPAVWFRLGSGTLPEEMAARDIDNRAVPGVPCPSYRAADMTSSIFAGPAELVRAGVTTLVTDLRAGQHRTCFCERCESEFKAFVKQTAPEIEYAPPAEIVAAPADHAELCAAWREFQASKLADLYWTLRKQLDEMRRALDPAPRNVNVPLRLLAVVPAPPPAGDGARTESVIDLARMSGVFDVEIIDPDMNRAELGGTPAYVGGEVARLMALLPPGGKAGALVTAGSSEDRSAFAPVFEYTDVRDQVLEAVIGGSRAVVLAPLYGIDGMDLKQFSEAVALLAPFEDIIAEGEPVEVAAAHEMAASVRALGTENRFLVLVADYSAAPAAEVKVEFKLPADATGKPSVLVDVETRRVVAEIRPESPPVTVPLGRRARLFYLGPRDKLPPPESEPAAK